MDLVEEVAEKVDWIDTDILDTDVIYEAIRGMDIVIHSAALVSFAKSATQRMLRINRDGTANIVNACLEYQVKKLIHVSSIAVFSRHGNEQTIDEDCPWDHEADNNNYAISKHAAEMEVWRGSAEGLPVAIINPSLVLGSGFWDLGSVSLIKTVYDRLKFYPTGINGFVDVRDVARSAIKLIESETIGERIIVSAENLSYQKVFSTISNHLNRKAPHIAITPFIREIALARSWVLGKLFRQPQVITRAAVKNASKKAFFDSSKSTRLLNMQYIPIAQTLRETCAQFKDAAADNYSPRFLPLID